MDGMLTYVQEPLEISRRGSMGRHLNEKYVSSEQWTLVSRPLRDSVAYERDVNEGVPAKAIS